MLKVVVLHSVLLAVISLLNTLHCPYNQKYVIFAMPLYFPIANYKKLCCLHLVSATQCHFI